MSCVTYCAITLNRILLLLNDPLFHPSFLASLPPALNQASLVQSAVRTRSVPSKMDLTILNTSNIYLHVNICIISYHVSSVVHLHSVREQANGVPCGLCQVRKLGQLQNPIYSHAAQTQFANMINWLHFRKILST